MCGKHMSKPTMQCIGLGEDGKRCTEVGHLCVKHQIEQDQIKERIFAEEFWDRLGEAYHMEALTLGELEERIDAANLSPAWKTLMYEWVHQLREEEMALFDEEVPIHRDNQNVHRAVVTEQTNRGMEILLAQEVKSEQNTLPEIWDAWDGYWVNPVPRSIRDDMIYWYDQPSCRNLEDWLYRKALDGLWAMIREHKDKTELMIRLADEVDDSLGMCCEGHLCRLVNVMVGFDERFETPITKKELLQQKMAEIAAQDISVEQKALDAWKWMEENGIAVEERSAWIDAF